MLTIAIVSSLPRASLETQRVLEPPPCYHALSKAFTGAKLTSGDRFAADALREYDSTVIKVSLAAVQDRLPYNHDPALSTASTLVPHRVGTIADRRWPYGRMMSVLTSPRDPMGVLLAEPLLADVAPPELPKTWEYWAVPMDTVVPDPGGAPPSAQEASSAAADLPGSGVVQRCQALTKAVPVLVVPSCTPSRPGRGRLRSGAPPGLATRFRPRDRPQRGRRKG